MDNYVGKTILIYDGECNFCDSSVNYIIKHESFDFCYFTHLQSETGKKIAQDFEVPENFDGLLFLEQDVLYGKSEAVFHITRYLKFPFPLISFFFWIPAKLRDWIYDGFAGKRYKWFGKKECEMPSDEVKERFIE